MFFKEKDPFDGVERCFVCVFHFIMIDGKRGTVSFRVQYDSDRYGNLGLVALNVEPHANLQMPTCHVSCVSKYVEWIF